MQVSFIENKIYEIRGQKLMLDFDLAAMYDIETRTLKQAIKRNMKRFPVDFMFMLTIKEVESLVSQNVIPSKSKLGGALPFAFTEQRVSMLSSILTSDKAIDVNIAIIRTFVLLRQYALNYADLNKKIKQLEKNTTTISKKFLKHLIFSLLKKMMIKV